MDLALIVVAIAGPAWIPIVIHPGWRQTVRRSGRLMLALGLLTASESVQLVFLFFVNSGLLTLDYSLKFAAVGIPCSVFALITSVIGGVRNSVGISISSLCGILAWLFLITLH